MEKIRIRDGEKIGSVIRDKHPGSAFRNTDGAENVRGREKREPQNKSTEEPTTQNSIREKNQAASSKPSGEAAWEGSRAAPLFADAATAPEASIEAARPRRSAGRRPSPPPPPITSLLLFRISLLSRMSGVRDGK
jgi:hypothetical protein